AETNACWAGLGVANPGGSRFFSHQSQPLRSIRAARAAQGQSGVTAIPNLPSNFLSSVPGPAPAVSSILCGSLFFPAACPQFPSLPEHQASMASSDEEFNRLLGIHDSELDGVAK